MRSSFAALAGLAVVTLVFTQCGGTSSTLPDTLGDASVDGTSSSGVHSSSGASSTSSSGAGSSSSSGGSSGGSTSSSGGTSSSSSSSNGASSSSSSSSSGSSSGSSSSSSGSSSGSSSSSSGGPVPCDAGCGPLAQCCGGECKAVYDDPFNCGGCGTVCKGADSLCAGGHCIKPVCFADAATCTTAGSCCGSSCCGKDQLCCEVPGPGPTTGPQCFTPTSTQPTCPAGCPACQ